MRKMFPFDDVIMDMSKIGGYWNTRKYNEKRTLCLILGMYSSWDIPHCINFGMENEHI